MFFLVRWIWHARLSPLLRATKRKPQNTMTTKQALAHPAVLEIERNPGMDDYTVMIYLKDGYVARDGTSTLYGATIREATSGLKHVKEGEPD